MLTPDASPWKALLWAATSLPLWSGLVGQERLHVRWLVSPAKPPEKHDSNKPSFLLIPWFLCNANVMTRIGKELEEKYNVYYAKISRADWVYKSLPQMAQELKDEISNLLHNYETNWNLHLMWHSLWGVVELIALSMGTNIAVNTVYQLAAPNEWWTPLGKLPIISRIPAVRGMQKWATELRFHKDSFHGIESVIALSDNFVPHMNQAHGNLSIPDDVKRGHHLIPWAEHMDLILKEKTVKHTLESLGLKSDLRNQ